MEEQDDNTEEQQPTDRWEGFLTNVGQGISFILIVIGLIMLYRGCDDKPLLPPLVGQHEAI